MIRGLHGMLRSRARLRAIGFVFVGLVAFAGCGDAVVDMETAPVEDMTSEPLEEAPPLELGEYDLEAYFADPEFVALDEDSTLHLVDRWPGCIQDPMTFIALRTDGIELPAEPWDIEDPRMPIVKIELVAFDEEGAPATPLATVEDYPLFFETREAGPLEASVFLLLLDHEPEAISGRRARLSVSLETLGHELATREIEVILEVMTGG